MLGVVDRVRPGGVDGQQPGRLAHTGAEIWQGLARPHAGHRGEDQVPLGIDDGQARWRPPLSARRMPK